MRLLRPKLLLPAAYLAVAVLAWVDFVLAPPDGLANVGLMLVTLPVTLLGLLIDAALGSTDFVLMPDRFGYLGDHAAYYWPSVAAIAWVLHRIGRRLSRN